MSRNIGRYITHNLTYYTVLCMQLNHISLHHWPSNHHPRSFAPQKTILPGTWELPQDVPSRSSEFAHPDVAIGLTTLAYRYEVRMRGVGKVTERDDFQRFL